MKNQGIGKILQFESTTETDGIDASVIKQNFDTSRKRPGTDNNRSQKPEEKKIEDDNNAKHIETLTRTELLSTNGRCVLIDSNRRDLLYCMKGTISAENKQILRFTSICRSKQSRHTKSLLQTLQLLPLRKMRFSSKLLPQQNDDKLIKSLKKKSGHDAVLVLGDWFAANVKFHEPIRNKGLIQMLKKSGFDLYLINEYKTSSLCPDCERKLEKFKIVDSSGPYRRKDVSKVKCNGLLRCKDHSPNKLWNRDLAAVCNFRKILMSLRETGERASCFRQSQPFTKPSHKRKQG
ncbi:hypothetical protein BCV72DRAFT_257100 [Rhizopus microsporus var. microsporus]|uniref:Uncharacterized protein n=1 Tax=Rhizopus microsporus var. microsporus TaxID=86635 RepID=A0A1X0QYI8_RHIZD|nr:hypothetical protein BCV72DRAFT_257100 [Rhizopus microsporus var. microsporus]